MFSENMDVWHVVFYDNVALLNKLSFFNIEVYEFKQISDYKYCFETYRKNRKYIIRNFKDCKIVRKRGLINSLEIIASKVTFICVLIASLSLYNVSRRIWQIEIRGDYEDIESVIEEELVKHNLIVSNYYPSNVKLKEVEGEISLFLSKEVEFFELRRRGSIINVRYQKRRIAASLPEKKGNLYATKDGMIRYFNVQSGVKQVKEYQYVRKGDLLVSDIVETSGGDLINVGTLGSVLANTFYVIDVDIKHDNDDQASVFSKMLDKAKTKIGSYLSKNEKIEIERILNYSITENNGKMKVYYMLLEDITI